MFIELFLGNNNLERGVKPEMLFQRWISSADHFIFKLLLSKTVGFETGQLSEELEGKTIYAHKEELAIEIQIFIKRVPNRITSL